MAARERDLSVYVIRMTINDQRGAVSFVGPCHAIKMFVAGCSVGPQTIGHLLQLTRPYDTEFIDSVRSGLAVFDEFNTTERAGAFQALLAKTPHAELPPFRVLDDAARRVSLEPVGTGLILLNLEARRIIQVQNSYAEVRRTDRGRIREHGRPTRLLYHYRLPAEWRIVP